MRWLFPHCRNSIVKAQVIKDFSLIEDGEIVQRKSTREKIYVAIESIPGVHYQVVGVTEQEVYTSIDETYSWGPKPVNHFFGLSASLHIAHFINPPAKENLVLCDNTVDTICFLREEIAAIKVDRTTILSNPYFIEVIRSTFPNVIVSYPLNAKERSAYRHAGIKTLDLDVFIKKKGTATLYDYCIKHHTSDDFLEPLWDLFKYIQHDEIEPDVSGNLITKM